MRDVYGDGKVLIITLPDNNPRWPNKYALILMKTEHSPKDTYIIHHSVVDDVIDRLVEEGEAEYQDVCKAAIRIPERAFVHLSLLLDS